MSNTVRHWHPSSENAQFIYANFGAFGLRFIAKTKAGAYVDPPGYGIQEGYDKSPLYRSVVSGTSIYSDKVPSRLLSVEMTDIGATKVTGVEDQPWLGYIHSFGFPAVYASITDKRGNVHFAYAARAAIGYDTSTTPVTSLFNADPGIYVDGVNLSSDNIYDVYDGTVYRVPSQATALRFIEDAQGIHLHIVRLVCKHEFNFSLNKNVPIFHGTHHKVTVDTMTPPAGVSSTLPLHKGRKLWSIGFTDLATAIPEWDTSFLYNGTYYRPVERLESTTRGSIHPISLKYSIAVTTFDPIRPTEHGGGKGRAILHIDSTGKITADFNPTGTRSVDFNLSRAGGHSHTQTPARYDGAFGGWVVDDAFDRYTSTDTFSKEESQVSPRSVLLQEYDSSGKTLFVALSGQTTTRMGYNNFSEAEVRLPGGMGMGNLSANYYSVTTAEISIDMGVFGALNLSFSATGSMYGNGSGSRTWGAGHIEGTLTGSAFSSTVGNSYGAMWVDLQAGACIYVEYVRFSNSETVTTYTIGDPDIGHTTTASVDNKTILHVYHGGTHRAYTLHTVTGSGTDFALGGWGYPVVGPLLDGGYEWPAFHMGMYLGNVSVHYNPPWSYFVPDNANDSWSRSEVIDPASLRINAPVGVDAEGYSEYSTDLSRVPYDSLLYHPFMDIAQSACVAWGDGRSFLSLVIRPYKQMSATSAQLDVSIPTKPSWPRFVSLLPTSLRQQVESEFGVSLMDLTDVKYVTPMG